MIFAREADQNAASIFESSKQKFITFSPYSDSPALKTRASATRTAIMITISTVPMPFLLLRFAFFLIAVFLLYMPREIIAGVIATIRTLIKSRVMGMIIPNASRSCLFRDAFLHKSQQACD